MACTEDARRAVGTTALRGICLLLLLAPAAGCQVIFGLDEYAKQTGDACPDPGAPRPPNSGDAGICTITITRLDSLSTNWREAGPGAICEDGTYYAYFQRTGENVTDDLICAKCDAEFKCEGDTIIASGVINPYVRSVPPEIWVSKGGDIAYAPLVGCNKITEFTKVQGLANTGEATYPAISPGGTVLYFNRYEDTDMDGVYNMHIHVATRDQPDDPFTKEYTVESLFVDEAVDNLRAEPFWDGERPVSVLFSSNRGGDRNDIDDADVYIASAEADSPPDPLDAFGGPERISELSRPNQIDLAPWPLSDTQWLGAFNRTGSVDPYVINLDCGSGSMPDAGP